MKKAIALVTLLIGSASYCGATVSIDEDPEVAGIEAPASGTKQHKIEKHIGDVPGAYNFWLVEPLDTTAAKPVVIFLHGSSLRGSDLDRVRRYGTVDAVMRGRNLDAYVIAPQISGSGGWQPSKVKQILDYVIKHHKVDEDRIYVTGMSLGGYGTIDFAATYPDVVAAAAAFCGGGSVKNLSRLNEVPLWIVHGTADRAVTVEQSDKVVAAIKEVDKKAPRLYYDRVPGMNHSRPARIFYLPDLYEWLFMHRLSDPGRPMHKQPVKMTDEVIGRAYQGINTSGGSRSKGNAKTSKSSSKSKSSKSGSKSKSKSKKSKKKK